MDGVTVLGKLQNECYARLVSYSGNIKSPLYEAITRRSSQPLSSIFVYQRHTAW